MHLHKVVKYLRGYTGFIILIWTLQMLDYAHSDAIQTVQSLQRHETILLSKEQVDLLLSNEDESLDPNADSSLVNPIVQSPPSIISSQSNNRNRQKLPLSVQSANTFTLFSTDNPIAPSNGKEAAAERWISSYDERSKKVYYRSVMAGWDYFTNVTEKNRIKLMDTEIELGEFQKESARVAKQFPWKTFHNVTTRRILEKLSVEGMSALPREKFLKYTALQSEMAQLFGNATVCENGRPPPCELRLDPDINRIMSSSRDFGTLYYLWEAWRDAVGPPMRAKYLEFVDLANEGALLNGFHDTGDMWRASYEMDNLESTLEAVFDRLLPFYKQLHTYVRRRLSGMYPGYLFKDGPMPAHLLGNMWANSWLYLYEYTAPFPGKWSMNPTASMIKQNYTVDKVFREAEKFYKSLGFPALPEMFWEKSMFEQPLDRAVVCLPAAVDFRDGEDFRVKMCSGVSFDDFIQAHHQLGHIYYYMQYKGLPLAFRDGANPAFHDAIGSTMSMCVRTQQHMRKLGLIDAIESDPEADINFLYRTALERVAFLPFGYLVDKWRWGVFSGKYNASNLNQGWWELREKYQGVSPPIPRTEHDFDPAATFHISQHMPYIRYFISYVLQFQFLKAVCDAAGHQGPLMTCDIAGSVEAGDKLKKMMSLGLSAPWPDALQQLTGSRDMDVEPLLEYFQPLLEWLERENARTGEYVGWDGPGVLYPRADDLDVGSNSVVNSKTARKKQPKVAVDADFRTIQKEFTGAAIRHKTSTLLAISCIFVIWCGSCAWNWLNL